MFATAGTVLNVSTMACDREQFNCGTIYATGYVPNAMTGTYRYCSKTFCPWNNITVYPFSAVRTYSDMLAEKWNLLRRSVPWDDANLDCGVWAWSHVMRGWDRRARADACWYTWVRCGHGQVDESRRGVDGGLWVQMWGPNFAEKRGVTCDSGGNRITCNTLGLKGTTQHKVRVRRLVAVLRWLQRCWLNVLGTLRGCSSATALACDGKARTTPTNPSCRPTFRPYDRRETRGRPCGG